MRTLFILESEASTLDEVFSLVPWALVVIPVNGGWQVFESKDDYITWRSQK